jgi:hypothetical protein
MDDPLHSYSGVLAVLITIHSAATPSLRRGGKEPAGGGVAVGSTPSLLPEAGQPGLDVGTSGYEGFSYPANTSGIRDTRSSASTTSKIALRSRRASQRGVGRRWRTPLAMCQ